MGDSAPRVAQAAPLRSIVIPESFGIEAVDAIAELSIGHDARAQLRDERGIPSDRSLLHPDQPKFFQRASVPAGPGVPTPVAGQQPQQPLVAPPKVDFRPNGAAPGSLGLGLEKLVGKFQGFGFNTILRPQNGINGQGLSDNLFEMNFTKETLTFLDWTVLKDVPNRGFHRQEDVNLRGIPYTQEIKDLANGNSGKPDLPEKEAPGIHFEQGLLMRTPALTPFADDKFVTRGPTILPPTITRLASIPHGTTINAQGVEPTEVKSGAPVFDSLTTKIVLPFSLGDDPIKTAVPDSLFPQLNFDKDVEKDRIPINFKAFRDAQTINKSQFNNPNNYLKDNNDKLKNKIINHITFTVSTQPTLKLWGGGTANIAQLAEREEQVPNKPVGTTKTHIAGEVKSSSANANAIKVTCQYWISTVEDVIDIPAITRAELPRKNPKPELREDANNIVWPEVSPAPTAGVQKPSFQLRLTKLDKVAAGKAKVRYTQLQYSQNVTLDFGTLSWPHISVATLVPADPIPLNTEADFQRI